MLKNDIPFRRHLPVALYPAGLLVLQATGFFQAETGLWLGWLVLPFVWQVQPDGRVRWRWALVAAALLLAVHWAPVRTLLFLAGFAAWLFAVESLRGRAPGLMGLLGLVMSPVFFVAGNVFTFPLRLQLTAWAGRILQALGTSVSVRGNLLVCPDAQSTFTVEPACEGVALMQTAALLLVFLLAYEARRANRSLAAGWQLALFAAGLLLALGANLSRMVLLVQFRILPDSPAHDAVGLLGLLFYVVAPMFGMTRLAYHFFGKMRVEKPALPPPFSRKVVLANGLLLFAFVFQTAFFKQTLAPDLLARLPEQAGTMERRLLPGGVAQYAAPGFLAYVKPIPDFYSSEHHPALCWKGSGYVLDQIQEGSLAGQQVYAGVLGGTEGRLRTAWWYDNGFTRTIGQWDWRGRQWRGAPAFCIVNVTVPEDGDLEAAVRAVLEARLVR